jgi:hypothetical protein
VADIDVVKARSNSWIWWVIAAIAVVLLLMFLNRGRDDNAPARSPGTTNAPAQSLSVLVA